MTDPAGHAELSTLPVAMRRTVSTELLDANGHMNVRHYFDFGATSMWFHVNEVGMDESYIDERGLTTFTAEQHVRYHAEMREDDELTVTAAIVERGARSLHIAAFLLNDTRRELACVTETIVVHIDMSTRRPSPFPDDIAATIDASIAALPALVLPLSGTVGIRR